MEKTEDRESESSAARGAAEGHLETSVPRPVRVGMGGAAAPAPAAASPQGPEVVVHVDGVTWTARLLGCSGTSQARLLLVGFFHPEDPSLARRQALVVGRALDDLGELQMEAAWKASVPYVGPGTRRPFFPDIASRGGKDG